MRSSVTQNPCIVFSITVERTPWRYGSRLVDELNLLQFVLGVCTSGLRCFKYLTFGTNSVIPKASYKCCFVHSDAIAVARVDVSTCTSSKDAIHLN